MGLREEKKAEARQRISDVATRLFMEKGFDGVSVVDVALAANVSKMTVFNYFPRKEDLLLDRGDEARALARSAILDRERGNAIDGFRALADRLVAEGHPFAMWKAAMESFFRVIQASPSLIARLRELRELVEEELAAALIESAGTPVGDATADVLSVSMMSAWRSAHATTRAALHAGKRGDALGKVFLVSLDAALEPVRRAARGTPYGR